MKIVSFNINGLRARPHQLEAIVEKYQPEVIGLQETKVHDDMFPIDIPKSLGYETLFHGQKGHYGVALMSKVGLAKPQKGYPHDTEEAQKRLVAIDVPYGDGMLTIYNGYFPQGESRKCRNFFCRVFSYWYHNAAPTRTSFCNRCFPNQRDRMGTHNVPRRRRRVFE